MSYSPPNNAVRDFQVSTFPKLGLTLKAHLGITTSGRDGTRTRDPYHVEVVL